MGQIPDTWGPTVLFGLCLKIFIDIGNSHFILTFDSTTQSTRPSGHLLNNIALYSAQGSSLKPGE